jgi:general transcription factor 3C polypeptide 3 (transcription factor C subunit 4)
LREEHGPNSLVYDFTDYFQDVADALHAEGHNQEALKFYEPLFERERNQMKLRNLIGMHASYKALGKVDEAQSLIPELLAWGREGDASTQDIAIAAKFFEDNDMKEEAMKLARTLYMHRGGRFLQKVGFKGYAEVQDNLNTDRRVARVKHSTRKARDNAKMKALRATVGEVVSPMEDGSAGREVSFLDSSTELPEAGLFRTTKSLHDRRTKIFLPDDIPGTSVPNDAISQVLFRKRLNKLAVDYPEELSKYRKQHRDAVASFKRLEELLEAAENGDNVSVRQWMLIAEQLVREYCLFDLFYYDRRRAFTGYFRRLGSGEIWRDSALMELAVIANNVEDGESEPEITQKSETPPEKFYGIHFDNWFDLFAQYCIFLARNGNGDGCFKVFELADQSNIFHLSQDYSHKLQICRLACALTLDDSIQASDAIRCLLRNYPFATDLFRMYSGVNRFCSAPSGFSTGPTAKALIRHIKTMDYALLTEEQREWFNFRSDDRSSSWMINKASTNAAKHVKDHDPALFALYSHVLMCSGSYMAALNYYYRAFALTPDDPIINLGIGLAYIQHGMKRLSENRQFQIQQGLSFVYRYYEIRTKDSVALNSSEAEFNMGRVWHSLGLTSLAIPAYERCIQLSQQVQAEAMINSTDQSEGTEDFAVEAAFALQSIYALTGNLAGARRVTEEVLVIE